MNLKNQFDIQIQKFIDKKYPEMAQLDTNDFLHELQPLKEKLPDEEFILDLDQGKLSFVIVIKNNVVATEKAMSVLEKDGRHGITKLFPHEPKDFQIIDTESIPQSDVYLLFDIDRGRDTINLAPNEAMNIIRADNRLPLTIDEGVAIVTQYPEFLMKNNCFSLLASRHEGDQRVPAIWINTKKEPNLGWCWDGNPHTWLGSASAGKRII